MFALMLVAQSFGTMDQYLEKAVSEEDFWCAPERAYQSLDEEEKKQNWFMLNPQKLKEKYRLSNEALIVTEQEKRSLLKAFDMLYEYSKELPDNTSFKERLLTVKGMLPPVFFASKENQEECKIIPFKKD
jgi:hypothetical protein